MHDEAAIAAAVVERHVRSAPGKATAVVGTVETWIKQDASELGTIARSLRPEGREGVVEPHLIAMRGRRRALEARVVRRRDAIAAFNRRFSEAVASLASDHESDLRAGLVAGAKLRAQQPHPDSPEGRLRSEVARIDSELATIGPGGYRAEVLAELAGLAERARRELEDGATAALAGALRGEVHALIPLRDAIRRATQLFPPDLGAALDGAIVPAFMADAPFWSGAIPASAPGGKGRESEF